MDKLATAHLTTEADHELVQMVRECNDGFTSGKVTKTQMLSWIVRNFRRKHSEKEMEQIRADHFDKIAHLTSVIKAIKAAEAQGQKIEIDELLSPLKTKKSPMKTTQAKPDEK